MSCQVSAFFKRNLNSDQDVQIFSAVYGFNKNVLKTNFYRSVKTALAFRLNPAFLGPLGVCPVRRSPSLRVVTCVPVDPIHPTVRAVVVRAAFAEIPYGVFFVIGSEFRGFHIRFRDVARGGIRIVKSPNLQVRCSAAVSARRWVVLVQAP